MCVYAHNVTCTCNRPSVLDTGTCRFHVGSSFNADSTCTCTCMSANLHNKIVHTHTHTHTLCMQHFSQFGFLSIHIPVNSFHCVRF